MVNTYEVGFGKTYATVQDAIADINLRVPAPSYFDRVVVLVWPGAYDSTAFGTIDIPAYTSITAAVRSHDATQLYNDTAPLFRCVGNNVGLCGLTIYPPFATDLYAILGNNQDRIRIEDCNMWAQGGSREGRFFKQDGPTWVNAGMNRVVINAATTTKGALATDEGVVMFRNSGSVGRFCDVWIDEPFWDCHTFTAVGNVLANYGCDDVRVMGGEIRSLPPGSLGRAVLTTTSGARTRISPGTHLEGNLNSFYTNTGCTTEVYNCETRGRFGATFAGPGARVTRNSSL